VLEAHAGDFDREGGKIEMQFAADLRTEPRFAAGPFRGPDRAIVDMLGVGAEEQRTQESRIQAHVPFLFSPKTRRRAA